MWLSPINGTKTNLRKKLINPIHADFRCDILSEMREIMDG